MTNKFGFGKSQRTTPYDRYIGETIVTNHNSHGIVGVLKKIDAGEGVAFFSPFISYNGNHKAYVNKKVPAQMPLPLGPIYPINESLEEYVKGINNQINFEKNKDLKDEPIDNHS